MDHLSTLFLYSGNLVILNLVLQIALLAATVLLICRYLKHHVALRYSLLFTDFNVIYSQNDLLADILQVFDSARQTSTLEHIGRPEVTSTVSVTEQPFLQLLKQIPVTYLLLFSWILGVLIVLCGLGRSLQNVDKLRRDSRCLSVAEKHKVDRCLGDLCDDSELQLRISKQAIGPMLVGIFKPSILLPNGLIQALNMDRLAAILQHEIAHLQRQDSLANLFQKFILVWFWFHPLVRLMDKNISRAREEICDYHVLVYKGSTEYG